MGDNKRGMIIEDGLKEMVKKGISFAEYVESGLKGKQMPKLVQRLWVETHRCLENPLDSKRAVIIVKNPTKVIKKNKNFLLDLIKYGFDEKEMPKLFQFYHGLCSYTGGFGIDKLYKAEFTGWLKAENFKKDTAVGIWKLLKYWKADNPWMKILLGIPDKKFRKNVDYVIRTLTSLYNNPMITDETKKQLAKERSYRLELKKFFSWKPLHEGPIHPDEKDVTPKAKSWKQMRGFQVVKAYDYIKPFVGKTNREMVRISSYHKEYRDKDVFALICEFLNQIENEFGKHTEDSIKNLYFNNVSYNSII